MEKMSFPSLHCHRFLHCAFTWSMPRPLLVFVHGSARALWCEITCHISDDVKFVVRFEIRSLCHLRGNLLVCLSVAVFRPRKLVEGKGNTRLLSKVPSTRNHRKRQRDWDKQGESNKTAALSSRCARHRANWHQSS